MRSRTSFTAIPSYRHTIILAAALLAACTDRPAAPLRRAPAFHLGTKQPDELPKVINADIPFHYPASMYARKVQGNATLHLFVDRDGRPRADSTRVEESSGYPALDSAALRGAPELRFVPAKVRGEATGITVLFPVYFRHPEARALPGDTILTRRPAAP